MTANDALCKMQQIVSSSSLLFDTTGVKTSVETEFLTLHLDTVDKPEDANFISVSLILSVPELKEEDAYSINLVATVINGKAVKDMDFQKEVEKFNSSIAKALQTFEECSSPSDAILALDKIADEESEKVLNDIKKLNSSMTKGMYGVIALVALIMMILMVIMVFR